MLVWVGLVWVLEVVEKVLLVVVVVDVVGAAVVVVVAVVVPIVVKGTGRGGEGINLIDRST